MLPMGPYRFLFLPCLLVLATACDRPFKVEITDSRGGDAFDAAARAQGGRFTMLEVSGVVFRLNNDTGEVAWCNTHACFRLPEGRVEDSVKP